MFQGTQTILLLFSIFGQQTHAATQCDDVKRAYQENSCCSENKPFTDSINCNAASASSPRRIGGQDILGNSIALSDIITSDTVSGLSHSRNFELSMTNVCVHGRQIVVDNDHIYTIVLGGAMNTISSPIEPLGVANKVVLNKFNRNSGLLEDQLDLGLNVFNKQNKEEGDSWWTPVFGSAVNNMYASAIKHTSTHIYIPSGMLDSGGKLAKISKNDLSSWVLMPLALESGGRWKYKQNQDSILPLEAADQSDALKSVCGGRVAVLAGTSVVFQYPDAAFTPSPDFFASTYPDNWKEVGYFELYCENAAGNALIQQYRKDMVPKPYTTQDQAQARSFMPGMSEMEINYPLLQVPKGWLSSPADYDNTNNGVFTITAKTTGTYRFVYLADRNSSLVRKLGETKAALSHLQFLATAEFTLPVNTVLTNTDTQYLTPDGQVTILNSELFAAYKAAGIIPANNGIPMSNLFVGQHLSYKMVVGEPLDDPWKAFGLSLSGASVYGQMTYVKECDVVSFATGQLHKSPKGFIRTLDTNGKSPLEQQKVYALAVHEYRSNPSDSTRNALATIKQSFDAAFAHVANTNRPMPQDLIDAWDSANINLRASNGDLVYAKKFAPGSTFSFSHFLSPLTEPSKEGYNSDSRSAIAWKRTGPGEYHGGIGNKIGALSGFKMTCPAGGAASIVETGSVQAQYPGTANGVDHGGDTVQLQDGTIAYIAITNGQSFGTDFMVADPPKLKVGQYLDGSINFVHNKYTPQIDFYKDSTFGLHIPTNAHLLVAVDVKNANFKWVTSVGQSTIPDIKKGYPDLPFKIKIGTLNTAMVGNLVVTMSAVAPFNILFFNADNGELVHELSGEQYCDTYATTSNSILCMGGGQSWGDFDDKMSNTMAEFTL